MSPIKEKEIRNAVKRFFEREGYFVPPSDFDIGVRPDVVAFRWSSEYEIEAIAVECKKAQHSRALVEAARSQALKYQQAFPYTYLASPMLLAAHLAKLKTELASLRIGLLLAKPSDTHEVSKEFEPRVSPRLVGSDYLFKVRQRVAAILSFKDALGVPDFEMNLRDPTTVWCWTKEAANFLIGNGDYLGDYCFGICVEQKGNVEKTLGRLDSSELYRLIKGLPEGYLVYLDYIDAYYPQQVSWRLLAKQAAELAEKDVEWIRQRSEQADWKVRFRLHKRAWGKDEVLSKSEHIGRLKGMMKDLDPIRQALRREE